MKMNASPYCAIAFVLIAQGSIGCSSAEDPAINQGTPGPDEPEDSGESPALTLEWKACTVTGIDRKDRSAECALVDVPAKRGNTGATFPVHVTRLRGKGTIKKQVWLLAGGPGSDGASLGPYGDLLVQYLSGADVYLPDHRGTGKSNLLSCASEDLAACGKELKGKWGETLQVFSTTAAAYDVIDLMRNTRAEGQTTAVMGLSYGSYWAHRVLQLAPGAFDAAVFDGVCVGEKCRQDRLGENHNEGFQEIMRACASDTFCSSKLGTDPMKAASDVASGTGVKCGVSAKERRGLFLGVSAMDGFMLAPLVHRFKRCNANDEKVLAFAVSYMASRESVDSSPRDRSDIGVWGRPGYSKPLGSHVRASEMTNLPLRSDAEHTKAGLALPIPYEPASLSWVDAWPRAPRDARADQWAKIEKPLLLGNGAFDLQTPISIARSVKVQLDTPATQLVEHPTGGHVIFFESPCTLGLLTSFLRDPTEKVDASCLQDEMPDRFKVDRGHSKVIFNTEDAWEGIL